MIFTLVKVNLRALFAGVFRRSRGKKKTKPITVILIGLLAAYVAGALAFSAGMMFYPLGAALFETGTGWFYFALAGIIVFALCFIGSVFMVQSQIFNARDNELLLSMPIKPSAILFGRIASLLVIEYIFQAIIIVPAFVVLCLNGYITYLPALGIVFFVLAAILLPLLPLSLGCLFGWLIAVVTSRMRSKQVFTLVLSLGFLTLYFWGYSKIMGYMTILIERGAEIAEAVRRAVPPAYHMGVAVESGDVLSFLMFALCVIVPFLLLWALLSASFVRIATARRGAKKIRYREKGLRTSGVRAALLKRELLHLWSLPMYILNSALGAVASLAAAAVLIVRPGILLNLADQAAAVIPGISPGLLGVIALSALAVTNFISAPSISLEGRQLWIVKSLPVRAGDILLAKAWMHIVACGVPALLAGLACIMRFQIQDAGQIILMIVMPQSVTLLFSLLGVTLNLTFPRLDWVNTVQPIKQGLSSMLSMFGGMALVVAIALAYGFLLSSVIGLEMFLILCTIIFLAASAVLYFNLINGGCRKFEELN